MKKVNNFNCTFLDNFSCCFTKNNENISSPISDFILRFFIVILFTFGVSISFFETINTESPIFLIGITAILTTAIFSFKNKRSIHISVIVLLSVVFVLCILSYKYITIGFINTLNILFERAYMLYGAEFYYINNPFSSLHSDVISIQILFIFILTILCLCINYILTFKSSSLFFILIETPFIVLNLFLSNNSVYNSIVFLFFSLICCMGYTANAVTIKSKDLKNNSDIIIHKRKNYTAIYNKGSTNHSNFQSSIIVFCLTVILIFSTLSLYPSSKYNQYAFSSLKNKITNMFTGKVDFTGKSSSGINGGILGDVYSLNFDGKTDLVINYNGTEQRPMYLKAFVGATYNNNRWSELPNSVYNKNENLFVKMKNENINPINVFSNHFKNNFDNLNQKYYTDTGSENVYRYGNLKITVNNVDANSNYLYSPYIMNTTDLDESISNKNFHYDSYMRSFGNKQYSFYHYTPLFNEGTLPNSNAFQVHLYNAVKNSEMDKVCSSIKKRGVNFVEDTYTTEKEADCINRFLPTEKEKEIAKEYRDFAYQNYTQVPDNIKENLQNLIIKNCGNAQTRYDVFYTVGNLAKNIARYNLSPGRIPKNKDFVDYFLFESKEGYCTYFASSEVLLYRSIGIPARYVEGYVVTSNDINKQDAKGNVELTDRNAHAWVEIYIEPFGWIPVEVTPGFNGTAVADDVYKAPSEPSSSPSSQVVSSDTVSSEISSTQESSNIQSKPNSSSSNSTDIKTESKQNIFSNSSFIVIFSIVTLIILLFLFLIIRRYIVIKRRTRDYNSNNTNKAISAYYKHIVACLGYKSITMNNLSYEEFAKSVDENMYLGLECQMSSIIKTIQKVLFSKELCSQNEYEYIKEYDKRLVKRLKSTYNFASKFAMSLIYNLF